MSLLVERVDWDALGQTVRTEQRNREIHTPLVSLYRWWARRSHALIGALLDAASEKSCRQRLVVSDPLSGGGTVAIEAVLRGHRVYAQDLHPWAVQGLATALDGANPVELEQAGERVMAAMSRFRDDAYGAECFQHGPSVTAHAFWVRESHCPGCAHALFLFPYSLITVQSRSTSESQGQFGCTACGSATRQLLDAKSRRCGTCHRSLPAADSPLLAKRRIRCPHCGHDRSIADLEMVNWKLALVQRLCQSDGSTIAHFDIPGTKDLPTTTSRVSVPPSLEEEIPDGLETRVLRLMGFRRWADLYPDRQLRSIIELAQVVKGLDVSEVIHGRLLLAIVGAGEMAGYLCRWDRYHPKAFEAMANHRFSPVGLSVEVNLLSTRGRGTVPHRLAASVKAAKWATERFPKGTTPAALALSIRRRSPAPPSRPLLVVGSSERQLLPAGSVDLVLTDPPYFGSVQYGELSAIFQVWSNATQFASSNIPVDLKSEAVPNSTRGTGLEEYRTLLERIFVESARSLKPGGTLLLTFHSTDIRAWHALASALAKAQLDVAGLATCHSENNNDHSKRGKRTFTKDLIIECQHKLTKRAAPTVAVVPKDDEDLELVSAGLAMSASRDGDLNKLKKDFLKRIGPCRTRRIH